MKKTQYIILFLVMLGGFAMTNLVNAQFSVWYDVVSTNRLLTPGETVEMKLYEVIPVDNNVNNYWPNSVKDITSEATWHISDDDILEMISPGIFRALELGETEVWAEYEGREYYPDYSAPESSPKFAGVQVVEKTNREDYDVKLAQIDPIFGAEDVGVAHFQNRDVFGGILSLTGADGQRYFAVGGYCSMVESKYQDWFSRKDMWGKGGLYLFSDNGEHVDTRDACYDAAPVVPKCKHDTGCNAHFELVDLGGGNFVREMSYDFTGSSFGSAWRPMISYKASSRGLDLLNRTFYGLFSNNVLDHSEEKVVGTAFMAVANNLLVDIEQLGGSERAKVNSIYTLPSLSKVAQFSQTYTPMVGVGEYFLATDGFRDLPRTEAVWVYRMPSATEVVNGAMPEKIQNLKDDLNLDGFVVDYTVDVLDSNRLALNTAEKVAEDGSVTVYTTGPNGLEVQKEYDVSGKYNHSSLYYNADRQFSLMGDYLSYAECYIYGADSECSLIVLKNDSELSVEPLPVNPKLAKQMVRAIEISPSGNILVGTSNGLGTGIDVIGRILKPDYEQYLYLYQIKDFEGAQPTSPTTPQTQTPQNIDINALMRQYGITPLRDYNFQDSATSYSQSFSNTFFNSNDTNTLQEQSTQQNTYTLNRPPQTIAEIRAFQCAYNIVCEGSISTTGYGNLGPKTQAKINEVFGQDGSVNGTQTTIQTSGMTIQEMQELINQLLQQVAELQAQLSN